VDALAAPFVQGQLRSERLSASITTECAHCHMPLHLEIDSELCSHVVEADAAPLAFMPLGGVAPGAPSIIDGF
jgi:hypothetical protein